MFLNWGSVEPWESVSCAEGVRELSRFYSVILYVALLQLLSFLNLILNFHNEMRTPPVKFTNKCIIVIIVIKVTLDYLNVTFYFSHAVFNYFKTLCVIYPTMRFYKIFLTFHVEFIINRFFHC